MTANPTPGRDELLAASAPPVTPQTPALIDELARMAAAAGARSGIERPRRRPTRTATVSIAAVLVLAGAGTAAAGAFGPWTAPWAETPDARTTFTLPSGATCEARLGNIEGVDPASTAAIQDYLAHVDIEAVIDVDAQIAAMRADTDRFAIDADGSLVSGNYGTPGYPSPDAEYNQAHAAAISAAITAELTRQGFDTIGSGISFEGETQCPGADW